MKKESFVEIQKISEFSNYLASSPKSYNTIAQFLVMNTFREENLLTGYIGELTESGLLCPIGGFGWNQDVFDNFPNPPIQSISPITNSIRNNEIILFHAGESMSNQYPDLIWPEPDSWVSGFAIPAYPIGGMSFVSSKTQELTNEKSLFFTAIGSLLGLYASRMPTKFIEEAIKVKEKINLEPTSLTNRQLVIAGLLERGFSNSQIGIEIGYSESLVRQETVSIYKKLNVTGREAMQLIRTLNLENLKVIES
jgi:DNA-binding CsgD family transcriptional regulator